MTCGSYCSQSVKYFNDVSKKGQIRQNWRILWPNWTKKINDQILDLILEDERNWVGFLWSHCILDNVNSHIICRI